MRDSGQVAEDLEGSDDEELRKAVEVGTPLFSHSRRELFKLNLMRFCFCSTARQLEDAVQVANATGRARL